MKNIFKMAVAAIAMVMVAFTANAQTKGDMAAGAGATFSIGDGTTWTGIGAKFQYNVMDPLRLEANFVYFLPKSKVSMWDFMVNAHWLFKVSPKINVYPLAGLGVLGVSVPKIDLGEFGSVGGGSATDFALNLGGGIDFFLSDNFFINAEAKYMIANGGSFMPSVGVGYKF
jgi:outer membrane protein X